MTKRIITLLLVAGMLLGLLTACGDDGTFTVEETDEAAPKMADYLNVTDSSVDYSA